MGAQMNFEKILPFVGTLCLDSRRDRHGTGRRTGLWLARFTQAASAT
jgi:hypothetical protein